MITALATIFVFGLIVFIHELGHFITAKMSGMQVDEFAIGFGPAIFKVQKGETLYSIRIIPLGGFNRIAGMTPDEPLNERSFYNKPAWKKFIVISAGAVFNFILAIVLFFGLNVTVGNLTYTNEPVIGNIIAGSSAEQAHLEANDRIITIDGKKISTWDDIRPSLQGTANHGVTVVVEREGQTIETTVIPKMEQYSPKIGIYPSFTRETYSIGESLSLAVSRTGQTIVAMVSGIYDMIRGTQAAEIISEAADPDANIIFGSVIDESLGDTVQITVVATGFNSNTKNVPEFGKTTTTSRPASTTNTNSGIPDIPVFMKR